MRRAATIVVITLAIALLAVLTKGCSDATPAEKEKDWTSRIDEKRAFADLEKYVALGPVSHLATKTTNLEAGRQFIRDGLKAAGVLKINEQFFKATSPNGETVLMKNIIGVLPGAKKERIILGAHYDMKILQSGDEFQGANDGASGVALLLELARHFAKKTPEFTIHFVFFDGEEPFVEWNTTSSSGEQDNTYGSRHMAKKLAEEKDSDLAAVIILDMVADADQEFERDRNSDPALLRIFESTSRTSFGKSAFAVRARPIADDHVPFKEAGYPVFDLIDLNYGPGNDFWHTKNDTVAHCDPKSLARAGTLVLDAWPKIEEFVRGKLASR